MAPSLASPSRKQDSTRSGRPATTGGVLVACPDARPPAYQAVVGLARAGVLHSFRTAFYHHGDPWWLEPVHRLAPERVERLRRALGRRHDPEIPAAQVQLAWSYDLILAAENSLASRLGGGARRALARWRTERFDRSLARAICRQRPDAVLVFSDVGSQHTLPACRALGIPVVLSMVHGDVREERAVLRRERERAPEFFPLYLGDGRLDLRELDWLHQRRLRDIALADRVLVPSDHIAETLARHGTPRERIRVVPYAADTRRFVPAPDKTHGPSCTFLFAGGITQRKGIKDLLDAWRRVKRPGWRLQLLGAMPRAREPLQGLLDGVEILGRVGHAEMPARMAAADVFVFPSLFEGSAVVTYEAMACGLPCIVTAESGAVARDGVEGLVVPAADVDALASAMVRLGGDPDGRQAMSAAARARAETFDWPRYHQAVNQALAEVGAL